VAKPARPRPEARARNPEATKRRILAAALAEFSAKGISGARVDRIAARARTNKRMLYHYFGSKESLYRAVLQQRLAERVPASAEIGLDESERLRQLHARQSSTRDYVRLLMWEALERGGRATVESEETRRAHLAAMVEAARARQADGRLPADLDPTQLVLTELAVTIFPFAFPQIVRMLTDRRTDDPAFITERAAFLGDLGRLLDPRAGSARRARAAL
jgi:AcrR family transcriptional regulator